MSKSLIELLEKKIKQATEQITNCNEDSDNYWSGYIDGIEYVIDKLKKGE